MARQPKQDDWEKDLADEASEESAREKSGGGGGLGNRISIKGRRFTIGEEGLGRELSCVILDFVYVNTFYDAVYNEEEANIPSCFAIAETDEDMVPHENVTEPQNEACEGCPMNEWGSANRGRGKACKNRRRLALIHVDDLEDIESAEVAFLEIPTTSIKNWSKYVKDVKDKSARPYYAVVTKLAFDEDEDYPVVTFELDEKIGDKETVLAIKDKRETVREDLMTPFEIPEEDSKPARKNKGKTARDRREEDDEDERPKRGSKDEDDDDRKPARRTTGTSAKPGRESTRANTAASSSRNKTGKEEVDENEDKPAKRRGSRFGR